MTALLVGTLLALVALGFVLLASPDVADAAVIGVYDERGDEVPKAFVVRAPGSAATEDDVLAFVAERTAPYKRVRRIEFIDGVPRAASGKILRRELRDRERAPAGQA